MATANFKVKNGLTVGNLSLTASTGNISSNVGNITLYPVAGSHVVVTGNLFVNGTDVSAALNTVSNAVSIVSSQLVSVDTKLSNAVSVVSNAVSVVSAAQLSTWNKVSAILTSSTTFSGATYSFTGYTNILGNLTVTGAYTVLGSNNIAYSDNIIEIHTSTDLSPLTSDDGKDIGLHIHYFKGTDKHAFLGWANDTGYLEWYDSGAEGLNTFAGNYGTMKLGNLVANASTAATNTTTGAIVTNGGLGVAGNAYIGTNLVVGSTNILDAISVVSAAAGSIESHVNTVSNAVSVVSAAVATWQ